MFRTILVPLDGSELADRILGHVRRLLRRHDARVVLASVVPDAKLDRPQGDEDPVKAARDHLERIAKDLNAEGASATTRVLLGDPAARIVDLATELDDPLIVLGTHGRSGLSRFIRGSVAERVLREATVPVLAANPRGLEQYEPARVRRILVPLDFSDAASKILPLAAEIARLYEAELVLYHAVDIPPAAAPMTPVPVAMQEADMKLKSLAPSGVTVRTRVAWAPPAEGVLEAVDREGADLVAMTTHGAQGFTRWAFGSTAEKVLRECACPVLILRSRASSS